MIVRLREQLRAARPQLRDRTAKVCAIGAVACLTCIIAHWSQEYPVERSAWEYDLFGDLTRREEGETSVALVPQKRTSPGEEIPHADRIIDNNPIIVEIAPSAFTDVAAAPIESRPSDEQPRSIQPVGFQQCYQTSRTHPLLVDSTQESAVNSRPVARATEGPLAWFCGCIEAEPAETKDASSVQPVTIHFP